MTASTPERQRHLQACHLCEAICGLVIETRGEEIVSIRGDQDDPLSRGHICPKAVALKDLHEDPDRLRAPLKRSTGADGQPRWETVGWDEALDLTARSLVEVYNRHGVHAIGIYLGNPAVHNYGMLTHQGNLLRYLRTNNRFSATSVDQLPHHLASLWLFGHKLLFPIPDIDRSDYFLMLGANPVASNGSIWTVPDVRKRIKAMRARDGKLVIIDPRRTETAELADAHHFIRPGTDALFLLALLNTLFAEELADPGHLAAFTTALDEVAHAVRDFTPEYAAAYTGIRASSIRDIARDFAGARVAALLGLDAQAAAPPEQIVDMGLQLGPSADQGLSLQKLRDNPSGIDLRPLTPQLPGRLKTQDQLIHCDTTQTLADLERLRAEFPAGVQSATTGLRLIGRRHVRSNNSWMHNFHRLVKGADRCTLLMHPDDLRERNIAHGSEVTISSRVSELEVTVEASESVMPGVVSLPHGYGHHRAGNDRQWTSMCS